MTDINDENIFSDLVGCGRVRILLEVLEEGGLLSPLEYRLMTTHCRECESCKEKYEVVSKK